MSPERRKLLESLLVERHLPVPVKAPQVALYDGPAPQWTEAQVRAHVLELNAVEVDEDDLPAA